ncbi:REP-associated tyrosine transposase [Neobacillus cucumis]|uniref:REP-associated tyrosine transposase n=1 Tax=Neobacillus cucumis TaxID=1740721 RepID=UPI002E1CA739|nr:transposase [Neobacillus cucumis]MED4225292.1 transposase [Neobacillus cucumis]
MSRGARVKSHSGIYHVMWRGVNRQEIFHDDEDCLTFLSIVEKYKLKSELSMYAWCLMGNHVHLLVKEGNEPLSTTMKRIGVSFVYYYNHKYQTTGHLFQDRFRTENVENVRSLLTVVRYIHQNPVKAGMVGRVDEWRWSSCLGYYGKQQYPKKLLDRRYILDLFSDVETVAKGRFIEFNEKNNNDECLDDRVSPKGRLTDDEARREIKALLGVIEIAQVKSLPREQRNELLQEIKKIKGLSQRQAARILGIPYSLVFKARNRGDGSYASESREPSP